MRTLLYIRNANAREHNAVNVIVTPSMLACSAEDGSCETLRSHFIFDRDSDVISILAKSDEKQYSLNTSQRKKKSWEV